MSTSIEDTPGLSATPPSDREVVVERVFNAPPHVVWQAYTEPEQLAQWWGRGNPGGDEFMRLHDSRGPHLDASAAYGCRLADAE
jgi:uncharacterized protein YndB with AHSA1/START domain